MSETHKKQSLETQLGQKVTVTRENEDTEKTARAAHMLLDAGFLLDPGPQEGVLEYLGACAVHIYQAKNIGQLFFVTQTPLGNVAEPLADKAIAALRSDTMVAYGRKRAVKRSGL
jgi:hypothetical protein